MEIVHGIFLFEGEPGFAPLRSYIRYKDYNRENRIAKEKNKETRDKYLKIRSWEYFNQRKKRGKNQRFSDMHLTQPSAKLEAGYL
jgi:hypothetical protein